MDILRWIIQHDIMTCLQSCILKSSISNLDFDKIVLKKYNCALELFKLYSIYFFYLETEIYINVLIQCDSLCIVNCVSTKMYIFVKII